LCAAHGVKFDRYYKSEEDAADADESTAPIRESAQLSLAL
jgi:hypothetical protein